MQAKRSLAELRRAKGLTQRQLAALLGVTPGAVANWEVGIRTPSFAMARRIASELEVSLDVLELGPQSRAAARDSA